jgi:alpha-tubulin suppressor-like RCC1 family protein
MFGSNPCGQLGDATTTNSPSPIDILATNVTFVSAGHENSFFITSFDRVYAFGGNQYGQLGDGTTTDQFSPAQLRQTGLLSGKIITSIASGSAHTLALTADRKLFAWGRNDYGQIGDGSTSYPRLSPVQIDKNGALVGNIISSIYAGFRHSYALTADGIVIAWGDNGYGQLGDGTTTERYYPVQINMTGVLAGKKIASLSSTQDHALALSADLTVFAWGANNAGQLGDGTFKYKLVPIKVNMTGVLAGKTVSAISAGGQHSLALTTDGMVYAWGSNLDGCLGDGTTFYRSLPVLVDMTGALAGKSVSSIYAGFTYSLAMTTDNKLYAWGSNYAGQLGDGTEEVRLLPVPVNMEALEGKSISLLSTGPDHSLIITNDGSMYAWGDNEQGQLGINSLTNALSPTLVNQTDAAIGSSISSISTGGNHTLVLTSTGKVTSWGTNSAGQLGDGTNTDLQLAPIPVSTAGVLAGKVVSSIAAGHAHSLALTSDGMVYAWGSNYYGQLGDGPSIQQLSPVQVGRTVFQGKTMRSIIAGGNHSFAITIDNQLYGWGYNPNYQLGDGTTTTRRFPIPIDIPEKIISFLATCQHHTIALTSDNMLFAWGKNQHGQIGDGTSIDRRIPSPVDMTGVLRGKTVSVISVGFVHSLVLTADGQMFAFGSNSEGQLGDGTTTQRLSPVSIDMTSDLAGKTILSITAGYTYSLALASDGSIYSWGSNTYGQLGASDVAYRASPAPIEITKPEGSFIYPALSASLHSGVLVVSCDQGYSGLYCEYPSCCKYFITKNTEHLDGVNATDGHVCHKHGKCIAYNICKCTAFFQGDQCKYFTPLAWFLVLTGVFFFAFIFSLLIAIPITIICIRYHKQYKKQRRVDVELKSLLRENLISRSEEDEDEFQSTWMLRYGDLIFQERLAEGSFGIVFRGMYHNSPVAIKMIKHDDTTMDDFKQEVQVMKSLRHPNIVVSFVIIFSNFEVIYGHLHS